jgi:hypothetical protein
MEHEKLLPRGKEISPVPQFKWIEDLIWYDGPLVSILKNEDTDISYLFILADQDNDGHRWLACPLTEEDLVGLKKPDGYVDYMKESMFLIDTDSQGEFIKIFQVQKDEIPDYLPRR